MTARRETEAERLHRCRLIFERSGRDGISMAEAKVRVEIDAIRAEAAVRRRARPIAEEAESRRGDWWREGQYA